MNDVSFIEKLLNGVEVEWKRLEEVAEIISGHVFPKHYQGDTTSNIPFYKISDMNSFGNEIFMNKSNNYLSNTRFIELRIKTAPKGTIIFPKIGAAIYTNKKRILTQPSVVDNNISGLIPKDKVSSGYLFHYFQTLDLIHMANGVGAIPSISKTTLSKLKTPIPPLSIQTEIVRILDTFTTHTAELTAELTARKKQYNYYRDQLLTFEDGQVEWKTKVEIEWETLESVFHILAGGDVPKATLSDTETEEFNIPILSNGIGNNSLYGWTDKAKVYSPSLTISARGTIGWTSFRENPFFPIVRLLVLTPKVELNLKYAYYFMKTIENSYHVPKNGIPQLTKPMVKDIKFPIPPLNIQTEIVTILDKFEALTNSISEGLPREIKLRQQQYEYYRDLLLSFPKSETTV
ncbi:type I restriction enzyme, S subunit [Bathymodiolus platifrons methanotrophic gill symbiont]|uniref:restriction endonuclease subunit S n=1 Tax=Bathymodiolus platifrons methanotrophic gill symbiont TaxID=113268 RepID=UPI000B409FE4|nr:restriction endonuclease subunit S [Bathymodiolus platifrons methanotrophic gill symbiont]GAW86902.1 type I restriction enzyme, S subunit [Bathymodiolus platifrons methanotrophic gill symbiont]GFO76930.1 type I restriction enzyme, S subunit [Bathymodiolus platifrons methanotrophic gill symbiont]